MPWRLERQGRICAFLFGFDPNGDYDRITRENLGRRINLALPHDSLLLEKATGRVTHTGGKMFDDESSLYKTIVRWLEAGAPRDPAGTPKVLDLEIYPKQSVLEGKAPSSKSSCELCTAMAPRAT